MTPNAAPNAELDASVKTCSSAFKFLAFEQAIRGTVKCAPSQCFISSFHLSVIALDRSLSQLNFPSRSISWRSNFAGKMAGAPNPRGSKGLAICANTFLLVTFSSL
uniref:Uncharacterized protein n=1 Tax=Meloidogyne incognita TaxID=6306 RepID=A0A914MSY9_MELIC